MKRIGMDASRSYLECYIYGKMLQIDKLMSKIAESWKNLAIDFSQFRHADRTSLLYEQASPFSRS